MSSTFLLSTFFWLETLFSTQIYMDIPPLRGFLGRVTCDRLLSWLDNIPYLQSRKQKRNSIKNVRVIPIYFQNSRLLVLY